MTNASQGLRDGEGKPGNVIRRRNMIESGAGNRWRGQLLVLPLLLLALASRAAAGLETDIPQGSRAVLSSGQWRPSAAETDKALAAIQKFLEKPVATDKWENREIQKILLHSKDYCVQFVGVVRDGKKIIWCNFLRARDVPLRWKQEKVTVADGGFWYWHIEYDPDTGKCLRFSSNGIG
jgi:hypothetical protein